MTTSYFDESCSHMLNKRIRFEDENVVEEPSPAVTINDLFENHVILEAIFRQLNTSDLLILSFVNKSWKTRARNVLQQSKHCWVRISRHNTCWDLSEFFQFLPTIDEKPYNGLCIESSSERFKGHRCIRFNEQNFLHYLNVFLPYFPIKTLHIDLSLPSTCYAVEALKHIIQRVANHLEALYLHINTCKSLVWNSGFTDFFWGISYDDQPIKVRFPNLKILRVPDNLTKDERDNMSVVPAIKELLIMAPNVKKLYGLIRPWYLKYIEQYNNLNSIREYSLSDLLTLSDIEPSQILASSGKVKLEKLSMIRSAANERQVTNPVKNWKEFVETPMLKQLFQSSIDTLQEFHATHVSLILFDHIYTEWAASQTEAPAFRNVRRLDVLYKWQINRDERYETLRTINYPMMFPNLEEYRIHRVRNELTESECTDKIYDFIINDEFRAKKAIKYTCHTVTKLMVDGWILYQYPYSAASKNSHRQLLSLIERTQQFYLKLFPNVKKVGVCYLQSILNIDYTLTSLWSTWPDLEEIFINSECSGHFTYNRDSAFLGIPSEECDFLKTSSADLETLKSKQIQPSILDLKKLKELRIRLDHIFECPYTSNSEEDFDYNNCFLSRKAMSLIFEHMNPEFKMVIVRKLCRLKKTKCSMTFDHLNDYVRLEDLRSRIAWDRRPPPPQPQLDRPDPDVFEMITYELEES